MRIYHHNWKALSPTFGHLTTDDVTPDLCRSYAAGRFAAGLAPATVNTELSRLSQAFKWAYDHHHIGRRPKVWIPTPGEPRSRVLSEDEVLRLLDACNAPHIRLFAILLLCTAGRHRAVLELTWDRVDFDAGVIDLRTPRKVAPMSKRHRKGRAVVAMNALARAALTEAKAGAVSDHVIEYHGHGLKTCKTGFAAGVELAGLGAVTPHTLRHTAGTWAWEKVDPARVARFLGHKTVRTTEAVYAHPRADFTAPAAAATGSLNLRAVKRD